MRLVRFFSVAACLIFVSFTAYAANYCLNCFEQIDENEKYCVICKAKLSVDELKTKEEQLIHAVTVSRENYRKSLNEIKDYYQNTGNQLRLQKARRELDALDKVPQPLYTDEGLGKVRTGVKFRDIEDANILFKDAMMYKKKFGKENRFTAIKRLEKLIQDYPDSNKADDAAFEIARIYESGYFADYESAAMYYIKSYQLNPHIRQPVLLKAAIIYERMLKDVNKAKAVYKQAALYSYNAKTRRNAERRLKELELRKPGGY
ncbi:MAG: hypothetical protein NG747_03075 [Candidatus Brocadia sp.]|nr:hypothetical protein [Candidatus Brocadia sp.]